HAQEHRLDQWALHAADHHLVHPGGLLSIQIAKIAIDRPAHRAGQVGFLIHAASSSLASFAYKSGAHSSRSKYASSASICARALSSLLNAWRNARLPTSFSVYQDTCLRATRKPRNSP